MRTPIKQETLKENCERRIRKLEGQVDALRKAVDALLFYEKNERTSCPLKHEEIDDLTDAVRDI